jgi:ABC-type transport system substrate-binding protein
MRIRYVAIVFVFCALLTITSVQNTNAEPNDLKFNDTYSGPYVDKVLYKVLGSENNQVQALLDDEIDILGGPISDGYYSTLDVASDVEVSSILRNGYGLITINCRDAPLNWTALRRAFAFAYDKTQVQTDVFQGQSQLQDSLIPYANDLFCIEDDLPYHYYNPEAAIGNQLLNDSGFDIDPVTGYRTDPNGNPIHIEISYAPGSSIGGGCAQAGVDALRDLHISAETNAEDFNTYIGNMYNHLYYQMIVRAKNFDDYDVDWLADQYWSKNVNEYMTNPSNFVNDTFDTCINQLINGTTYEEVKNASRVMQEVLHYNVPELVVYENYNNAAYRTDHFDGLVVDINKNIGNEWTNIKAHLNLLDGGPFSGTLRVSMAIEPSTFNPMTTVSQYSWMLFSNMFNSLLRTGPDGAKRFDLAEAFIAETHDSNPEVPDGHTRFTFDIIQNASWSDGTPLTADDIVYTFLYYYETRLVYGNPMGEDLLDLYAAFSPHPSKVVLEFSSESYWLLGKISDTIILQKTLLQSIGFSGWNSWNPVFSSDPYPTSGPFNITNISHGSYYELSYNPKYHHHVRGISSTSPEVSGPEDLMIVEGTYGHSFQWTYTDDNPLVFRIFKNGTLIRAEYCSSSSIIFEIDPHLSSFGSYNFTIEIKDWEYQRAVDAVIVGYVPDTYSPEVNGPEDILTSDYFSSGTFITWNVFDHNPANYTIFLDGVSVSFSEWMEDTTSIFHDIGSLAEGEYNFTLFLMDIHGLNSTDTVIVTVISDLVPPELAGPEDIEMMFGDLDVYIQWNASDLYPLSFEIFIDDSLNTSGSWESDVPIIFSLDGFPFGEYNVTIYVIDLGGNVVSDSVMVHVLRLGLQLTEMILIGIGGIAVVIVLVGIVIWHRR